MRAQTGAHDLTPPPFLQLAGHPLRWSLLRELARSDRMVSELTQRVGEPQNLVSYHLGKLRDGRLVSSRRSAADRRDTYYTLDLGGVGRLMSGAGAALHPGLRLSPPDAVTASLPPATILFLCTGNSARSQMAEALARAMSGGAVRAFSAGSQPKALHSNAVRVMAEDFDLDLAGQTSKHFNSFSGRAFDWVISLCDRVREDCPDPAGHPEGIHWSLPNPATGEPDEITYPLFQETAAELARRIGFLLHRLAEASGGPDGRSS